MEFYGKKAYFKQKFNDVAEEFAQSFIVLTKDCFGLHFLSMAVHCFTHLPFETMKHGPLETFSVFKFENNLKSLKRHMTYNMINPLATVTSFLRKNSTYVSKASGSILPAKGTPPKLKQQLSVTDFAVLILPNMYLSALRHPNPDCYVKANGRVLRIERIYVTATGDENLADKIRLECRMLKSVSAYSIDRSDGSTFESSSIGVYRLSKINQVEGGVRDDGNPYHASNPLQSILISEIQAKYVVNRFHSGDMVGHPLIDSQ